MSDVSLSVEGHVAHIRLNRPLSLNAITEDMDRALFEAWTTIDADPDIRVAILSGEGDRAFCVGADIKNPVARCTRLALGGGLTGIGGPLVTLRTPLIAAVHGYVLGGGFELAMCADIIVAAADTKFGLPETRNGTIGECGVCHRVIRQLPYRVALSLILTGANLSAAEALHHGLINEVVEPGLLMEAALRWAASINAASPLAVQAVKAAAISRADMPLDLALSTRFEPIEAYLHSEDYQEARKAFSEKRVPHWRGR